MKKTFIIPILSLFIFFNCEKVVDIDVPSIEPKLIIDASFEVLFNENPIVANTTIKLSLSADYFEEEIPTVTNATVFLTNLSNNIIIDFSDVNSDGNFKPLNQFIPEENTEYELTVIYNNETYKATATRIKSTPLKKVEQGDKTLFAGTETEVIASFDDDITQENYYFFDFSKDNYSILEDRFFNGQDYDVSNYYDEEDIELPTTITIKMSGISKDYFNYFRILLDQSGLAGGGPFQSVPSSLLGNVVNITNEDNFPLGYFHISETDTYSLDLIEK